MAGLGCLFVCTFGNFLTPALIAVHTANNLDFGNKPGDEGDENDFKELPSICLGDHLTLRT